MDNITYQSGNQFNNLPAGNYTAYIKDGVGCIGSAPVTVQGYPAIEISARYTNTSSCLNDGTIQANDPIGGRSPFTYSLDGTNFQQSKSFSGLAAGTYTLSTKDFYGCLATTSVTIGQNPINVTSYAWNASSCTATNGKIQLLLTGGVSPYSYSMDGVTYQSSPLFTNLAAGVYAGFVKDSKGCVGTKTGIVVGPTDCTPTFTRNNTNGSNHKSADKSIALNIQAYPNPTETEFTLSLEGYDCKEKISIIVTDVLGRKVYQTDGTGKLQYRFGNNFKTGIYLLAVLQRKERRIIKLIKE